MIKPNYKDYTLQQLLEAQEIIDKAQFPLRYKKLCAEIEFKKHDPQQLALVERKKHLNNLIFSKIIMALLSCFFASELYSAWQLGVASFRKSDYTLADNPPMFYFIVITNVVLLLVFLFLVFSNVWLKQAEIEE